MNQKNLSRLPDSKLVNIDLKLQKKALLIVIG